MTGTSRLVVGCMSGTSCDAVDAALVRVDIEERSIGTRVEGHGSEPLGPTGEALRRFSHGEALTAKKIAALRIDLAAAHAAAIDRVADAQPIDLIACHGQTVHHAPPLSWQMFAAAPIAARFGAPVVFDLRSADLAAGGQGAPITPLADSVLYGPHAPAAVVNLGGFCNITLLDGPGMVRGQDLCACNQLLDAAARRWLREPYDSEGAAAGRGRIDLFLAGELKMALASQASLGRSLGTNDEGLGLLDALDRLGPEDALATLASAIGATIGRAASVMRTVVLAGGGIRHAPLVRAIEEAAVGARVVRSDDLGVPAQAREAAGIAVLGVLCLEGVPITLPGVTGVHGPAPVAGSWALPPDGSWEVRRRG